MSDANNVLKDLADKMEAQDRAERRLSFLLLTMFLVIQVVLLNVGDSAGWPAWVELLALIGNIAVYCVANAFFMNRNK